MFGSELRDCDEFTRSLITNPEVLALLSESSGARQIFRCEQGGKGEIAWIVEGADNTRYLALFNTGGYASDIACPLPLTGLSSCSALRDLWACEDLPVPADCITLYVPPHGARLVKIAP